VSVGIFKGEAFKTSAFAGEAVFLSDIIYFVLFVSSWLKSFKINSLTSIYDSTSWKPYLFLIFRESVLDVDGCFAL